ncbi:hypothetical protein [Polaribacter sp. Asnod1-A03]
MSSTSEYLKSIFSTKPQKTLNLEDYFKQFREGIIGVNQEFESPYLW